jgi:hypothetical protein
MYQSDHSYCLATTRSSMLLGHMQIQIPAILAQPYLPATHFQILHNGQLQYQQEIDLLAIPVSCLAAQCSLVANIHSKFPNQANKSPTTALLPFAKQGHKIIPRCSHAPATTHHLKAPNQQDSYSINMYCNLSTA